MYHIRIQFVQQNLSRLISERINILTIRRETFFQFNPCIIDISNPSATNQWILEHISSSSSCINIIFSYYETNGLPNFTLNEIDCLNQCRYGMINEKYKVWVERKSALANLEIQSAPTCVVLTIPARVAYIRLHLSLCLHIMCKDEGILNAFCSDC